MPPEPTCDLHAHSTASDGVDAPEALVARAVSAGLIALSLTDHDTTAGLARASRAAAESGLAFLTGIELSADPASLPAIPSDARRPDGDAWADRRGTLHILGYGIDPEDAGLSRIQRQLHAAREERNPEMVERLRSLGVRIEYGEVVEAAGGDREAFEAGGGPGTIVGRPHIAAVLVRKGYARTVHEAFDKYVGSRGAAYVRKDRLSAEDAISTIRGAGGLAVLAHPVQLRLVPDDLEQAVKGLQAMGLAGVETRHRDHQPEDVRLYEGLARRFNLLETGGSDYHGREGQRLDECRVPARAYHGLAEALTALTMRTAKRDGKAEEAREAKQAMEGVGAKGAPGGRTG